MRLPRSPTRLFTLIEDFYNTVIACKLYRIPASSPNIWFVYNKSTQVEQLLENLLAQGLRESSLKKKLGERVKEMGLLRTLVQREAASSGSASSAAAPASTAPVAGPAVGSTADTTVVDSNAASAPAAAPTTASSASNTAASSSQPAPLAPNKDADQSAPKALSDLFVSVRAHLYRTVLYWENGSIVFTRYTRYIHLLYFRHCTISRSGSNTRLSVRATNPTNLLLLFSPRQTLSNWCVQHKYLQVNSLAWKRLRFGKSR